jgi:anti-sigma B factor antagonist
VDKSTVLQATTTSEGGRRIVRVAGELDLATAAQMAEILESAIESSGTTEIILDLADLRFLDASGIRVLVAAQQLAQTLCRTLRARNPHGEVEAILRLVQLAELFHLPEVPSTESLVAETGS